MYPVECVARGYLTGTGLLDYQASGEVCGIALPAGHYAVRHDAGYGCLVFTLEKLRGGQP